jgi:Tfp pilus assembly protein PilN
MIEINLSPTKKAGSITNVGGIDLSHINVKMMLIALLILFIPAGFIEDYFDGEIQNNQTRYTELNKELKKLNKKVRGMSSIQKQVDALNEQESKLAKKLLAVRKIINKRQNPFELMKYIVQNIPKDVWVISTSLNENNLIIRGYAKNWKSIGAFLESLKSSIFFAKQIDYSRPPDMNTEYFGQRVEVFEINAKILRYK